MAPGSSDGIFWVRKQSTSNVCKVQDVTERPQFGNKHLGPFDTAEQARIAMCNNLDVSMTDQTRCWEVLPNNACK